MKTARSYILGFILSIILTLLAFWLAIQPVSPSILIAILALLAVIQLIVQLIFFLHLGKPKEEWNIVTFAFALFVVVVILGGSLWIMTHLTHQTQRDTSEIW